MRLVDWNIVLKSVAVGLIVFGVLGLAFGWGYRSAFVSLSSNLERAHQETVFWKQQTLRAWGEWGSCMERTPSFVYYAKQFALSRKYAPDYRCLNFSKDLMSFYKARGIPSTLRMGFVNGSEYHAWVQVCADIEPQTGVVFNYTDCIPRKEDRR